MVVDEAEVSSGTAIDKLNSGNRELGSKVGDFHCFNTLKCYRRWRNWSQPCFAPGKFSELKSNAGLHLEEVVSALMEAAAMEAAAEIRETSADGCGANRCWHRGF